jgi:rhodanese-related sulfurtransferase
MIRDRLKAAARKAFLKAFGMERDAEASDGPPPAKAGVDFETQRSYIPPVVQGSGDTPGPNHRENIGRTWLVAQVASGAGPLLVDIRPPKECVAGMLPGAILLPEQQIKDNLKQLPAKTDGIVIYDQIGSDQSGALAAWLREQGWDKARKLVGGYAEWIEHDEPVEVPQPPKGGRFHVGLPVEDSKGRRGHIQKASIEQGKPCYLVLLDNGQLLGPLLESELRA